MTNPLCSNPECQGHTCGSSEVEALIRAARNNANHGERKGLLAYQLRAALAPFEGYAD